MINDDDGDDGDGDGDGDDDESLPSLCKSLKLSHDWEKKLQANSICRNLHLSSLCCQDISSLLWRMISMGWCKKDVTPVRYQWS